MKVHILEHMFQSDDNYSKSINTIEEQLAYITIGQHLLYMKTYTIGQQLVLDLKNQISPLEYKSKTLTSKDLRDLIVMYKMFAEIKILFS